MKIKKTLIFFILILSINFIKAQKLKYLYDYGYEATWNFTDRNKSIEKLTFKNVEIFVDSEMQNYIISYATLDNKKQSKKFSKNIDKHFRFVTDSEGIEYSIHGPKDEDPNIYFMRKINDDISFLLIFTDKFRNKY